MNYRFFLDFLRDYEKVLIPIITFVLGFFFSRFTLSLSERKQYEQKLFENGIELMEAQNSRFQEFAAVLHKYINKTGEPTLDDFFDISTVGEKYFYQLKISSDAIIAGKVSKEVRDNTLMPNIKEAVTKSLPTFYSTLQAIAAKKNIVYNGELKRENYESMYYVIERYAQQRN
ncbi:MAG: hypothetical protein KKA54_20655 [Proteobacteria bacterium]|nr:hypothetical protein [Pseudomonadota bacterium]MBU0968779.1 hypothetical protein [Pseudomonadota bacterium]